MGLQTNIDDDPIRYIQIDDEQRAGRSRRELPARPRVQFEFSNAHPAIAGVPMAMAMAMPAGARVADTA